MNTLVYADIKDPDASSASSIASTAQQMSISFGVAIAGLSTAFFVPSANSGPAPMIHGIHQALIALGGLTIASTIVFRSLKSGDGNDVSQHKVLHRRITTPCCGWSQRIAAIEEAIGRAAHEKTIGLDELPLAIIVATGLLTRRLLEHGPIHSPSTSSFTISISFGHLSPTGVSNTARRTDLASVPGFRSTFNMLVPTF